MDTFLCIFSDHIWFILLEGFISLVFLWSLFFDIRAKIPHGNLGIKINRGNKGWELAVTFWGLSIILVEIVISSDIIPNHRIIIGLLNSVILVYLNLFSAYYQNKIVGWYSNHINKFQNIN